MTRVFVGDARGRKTLDMLKTRHWGRLFATKPPTPYPGEEWGFDNGAFVAWKLGMPLDEARFARRLDHALTVGTPRLAVCPDIVAAGLHSLDYSLKWMEHLPPWPWYLAVQDGMTIHDVLPVLPRFAGIFLGGSDNFKTQAWKWCRFAHDNKLPFHYARAGTIPKMKSAVKMGADSLDSNLPLWTAARFQSFWMQYDGVHLQQDFPYMERA